jgi:hypothetical protein
MLPSCADTLVRHSPASILLLLDCRVFGSCFLDYLVTGALLLFSFSLMGMGATSSVRRFAQDHGQLVSHMLHLVYWLVHHHVRIGELSLHQKYYI